MELSDEREALQQAYAACLAVLRADHGDDGDTSGVGPGTVRQALAEVKRLTSVNIKLSREAQEATHAAKVLHKAMPRQCGVRDACTLGVLCSCRLKHWPTWSKLRWKQRKMPTHSWRKLRPFVCPLAAVQCQVQDTRLRLRDQVDEVHGGVM